MTQEKKYPFHYHSDGIVYGTTGATVVLENFVYAIKKLGKSAFNTEPEKSFHLYLFDEEWHIIADSVKDKYGKGEWTKEIIL